MHVSVHRIAVVVDVCLTVATANVERTGPCRAGCMCQRWGTVLSQLRFDRGVDGRAHCLSRGRTSRMDEDEDRNQALCVYSRKVQPAISRASMICSIPSPSQTTHAAIHPHLLILSAPYRSARKPGNSPTCTLSQFHHTMDSRPHGGV